MYLFIFFPPALQMGAAVEKKKKEGKKGTKISSSSRVYNWLRLSERPFLCTSGSGPAENTRSPGETLHRCLPAPPSPHPTSIHLPPSHSVRPSAAFLSVCHFLTTGLGGLSPLDYSDNELTLICCTRRPWGETFFCLSFFLVKDSHHHLFMMPTCC